MRRLLRAVIRRRAFECADKSHLRAGVAATTVLAELYASSRLYVNFFQPSFKLAEKQRDGARVVKRYHAPATPCQRLLADPRTPEAVHQRLEAILAQLDPIRLLHDIRQAQERLATIADAAAPDVPKIDDALDQFPAGLRTAWREGDVRPTARDAPKPKRERRRPDPVLAVTERLHSWFVEEPWRTGRELLAHHPHHAARRQPL